MKIIVVQQPWAWLIVAGYKPIENRTWATSYRGPLLIQSSAKRPADYDDACRYARDRGVVVPAELDFGGIVGLVTLTACVPHHTSPWFMGPIGWVLKDPVRIPFIRCRGQLGLFDASPELLAQIGDAIPSQSEAQQTLDL